jgi:hypothetical protein
VCVCGRETVGKKVHDGDGAALVDEGEVEGDWELGEEEEEEEEGREGLSPLPLCFLSVGVGVCFFILGVGRRGG